MMEDKKDILMGTVEKLEASVGSLENFVNLVAGRDANPALDIGEINSLSLSETLNQVPAKIENSNKVIYQCIKELQELLVNSDNEAGKMIEVENIRVEIPPAITRDKT